MDLGISGLNALVLGSSQGLGFSCAKALAEAGARVVVNGRDQKKAEAAATSIGHGAAAVAGDVSDPEGRARIVEEARALTGPISILVTNAGGPPPGPLETHGHDVWLKALESNMLSAIDMVRLVLPGMRDAGFGRIVNVTSFTVREPYPNMGLATGVRAGLTGAMASLAREVAAEGITVNNLLPGLMDTGALKRVYDAQAARENITPEAAKTRMADSVPMKRLGEADDFGPVCAFLCSRHAGYMTGQNITVDGGLVRALL
ncbi:putative 3-oxoacyl-acyl carrier protein reductase [Nitratireductor indicus C115]|uniref:Putative 3-oxoacyl-acyl carrier protein reductase n=1 Tax=Nitratireductor indicus C115 TaxID=1231190 RepID=K2P0U4_9HYPH|nr:SDR family oxidoreductase [Nitratireductor indicus]EKF43814.1 putative 3-oxoacyl-acyl carrier protein reductase [Nitratireductor indicus C115]SFQ16352.1 3-oxoacyl-[acyl-carrier protein] reductase [Nitratireductor indicus]